MDLEREHFALDFECILPPDIQLLAPTIYSRLNLLNYCQYLKLFKRQKDLSCNCEHSAVLEGRTDAVKHIISRIVETDQTLRGQI